MNIPIIEALKKQSDFLNADQIYSFPEDTEFGNLSLNWVQIIERVENINKLIIQLYEEFEILKTSSQKKNINDAITISHLFYHQKFLTEQIFYWLRKTADEIICMLYLLNYLEKNKHNPKKLKISSIGEYLNSKTKIEILENFRAYFKILNDISNAYKHSFVNAQIHTTIAIEHPTVFALAFEHNNRNNELIFHQYSLTDVLENYQVFLITVKKYFDERY